MVKGVQAGAVLSVPSHFQHEIKSYLPTITDIWVLETNEWCSVHKSTLLVHKPGQFCLYISTKSLLQISMKVNWVVMHGHDVNPHKILHISSRQWQLSFITIGRHRQRISVIHPKFNSEIYPTPSILTKAIINPWFIQEIQIVQSGRH